ncbi:MAG: hypothetical protein KatS3mg110_3857 [Pirellulaceae bacterium]|nr:MAG: hypothetical protein KatS3mg110_3857 [Pirellulaceae bacterium]
MRLAPVPMFYFPDLDASEYYAAQSSRTTHGAPECVDACRLLARIICRALAGMSKQEVALQDAHEFEGQPSIQTIANGDYLQKSEDQIRGSGYVAKSLEAALWCFMKTSSFRDAILQAANLGDDADTTAAVCGQIAGAYYGVSGIPSHWLERLAMCHEITKLADQLFERPRSISTLAKDG